MTEPRTRLVQGLAETRLLAILRGTAERSTVQAALALLEAGVRYLEISLTTPGALRVLSTVLAEAPADAEIGAGTVLSVDDARRVQELGVRYAVTPALTGSVAECVRLGLPVFAGALTPTECVAAMDHGASAVKLFPASLGGPGYLRALREPLPGVPFVPVGGIDVASMGEYLRAGALAVGVGGPLLGDAATEDGNLSTLRERAQRFLAAAAGHSA